MDLLILIQQKRTKRTYKKIRQKEYLKNVKKRMFKKRTIERAIQIYHVAINKNRISFNIRILVFVCTFEKLFLQF